MYISNSIKSVGGFPPPYQPNLFSPATVYIYRVYRSPAALLSIFLPPISSNHHHFLSFHVLDYLQYSETRCSTIYFFST